MLSNGIESPVFFGKTQNGSYLQEISLTPDIKKIRGTVNSECVKHIIFQNKAGNDVTKMVAS